MSKYHAVSGHTRVVDSISKELVNLGHKVTLGSFHFEKEPPNGIIKLQLKKSNIKRKINEGEFDIIHNHQTLMNYHLLFLKKPIIFHYHGASNTLQKINLKFCSIICKNSISKIISISESAMDEIQKYFPNTSNSVIYNGVDSNFYIQNEKKRKSNDLQLLFVGNLFEYKNVQLLIREFPKMKKQFPNLFLKIIGDGEYKKQLSELIVENDLQKNIELVGRVDDEELREHFSSSDLYITASTWEFFNLPLLEAMSCGKPIIVSNLPVHQELVSKSNGGEVFSLDGNNLVEKIEIVMKNYDKYSKNARDFALENDWSAITKKVLRVYEELI